VAYSQENYDILLDECQRMYEELADAKTRLGEVTKSNFELEIETKRLNLENAGLKKDNQRLTTELVHHQNQSKAALKQLEVLKRANIELVGMRNHEALKYQMDNEHCRLGLLSLHEAREQLARANEELIEQFRSLKARLEDTDSHVLAERKARKIKEMEENERIERENKTVFVLLKVPDAFALLSQYLKFKEYHHLASLNRAFNDSLRR